MTDLGCKNCGRPLGELPSSAPHKVFCCTKCRNEWHERDRRSRGQVLRKEAICVEQQTKGEPR